MTLYSLPLHSSFIKFIVEDKKSIFIIFSRVFTVFISIQMNKFELFYSKFMIHFFKISTRREIIHQNPIAKFAAMFSKIRKILFVFSNLNLKFICTLKLNIQFKNKSKYRTILN